MRAKLFICCCLLSMSVLPGAVSNDTPAESATTVLWGDAHLHTEASIDASAFGNRLDRDTAYRFAKGEPVVSSTGQRARLTSPQMGGIALGYEDLNDHDALRGDSLLALWSGKADLTGAQRPRERGRRYALAGSSTLNRLELGKPEDAG